MVCLILKLCLAILISSLASPAHGSRSINNNVDFAVEVNVTNFDAVIRDTPATYAVVEFFASWCPACKNYKPQYEKVARLFNGADAIHPGIILMAKIDCALEINSNICSKFSVSYYPMLLWGPSAKFISGRWAPKQENSDMLRIENGRTADRLLDWINKQIGSTYGLDDVKFGNEQTDVSDPRQIARAIYDVEEATAIAFDLISEHKMVKPETRASLISFLQLIVAHHPSRKCQKGAAEILVNFDALYPSKQWSPGKTQLEGSKKGALSDFSICGKQVPRGYWIFCRGSKKDTRGLSCGLWVLLHSLSMRIDDGESQMAFKATCNFIHDFFICEECRQHFYDMCSSVPKAFHRAHDFALWLWEAHNKVSERLMKEEASLGTGDPKFPKIIWPSVQLCPSCYSSQPKSGNSSFNRDEVFRFFTSYYGETLVTLHKNIPLDGETEKAAEDIVASANAIVVPVGAALAIAVASCAFGALSMFLALTAEEPEAKEKVGTGSVVETIQEAITNTQRILTSNEKQMILALQQ